MDAVAVAIVSLEWAIPEQLRRAGVRVVEPRVNLRTAKSRL